MQHVSLKKDGQPNDQVIGEEKARETKDLVPGTSET